MWLQRVWHDRVANTFVFLNIPSLHLLSQLWSTLENVPCAFEKKSAVFEWNILSVLFSSVTQSCLTLCDPMDCSIPGFPVHPQLPEFTQTHAHRVGDAINHFIPFSSRLQSFPASRFFQMSQLFVSGSQSIRVSAPTSVLPMNTQDWSPLGWTGWISLQSKGLPSVFSDTTV